LSMWPPSACAKRLSLRVGQKHQGYNGAVVQAVSQVILYVRDVSFMSFDYLPKLPCTLNGLYSFVQNSWTGFLCTSLNIYDLSLYQILLVQWFINTIKLGQSWRNLFLIPVTKFFCTPCTCRRRQSLSLKWFFFYFGTLDGKCSPNSGAKRGMSSPAPLKILLRKLAITVNVIEFLY
jgi:hypothetical protein